MFDQLKTTISHFWMKLANSLYAVHGLWRKDMKRSCKLLLFFVTLMVFQSPALAWGTYSDLADELAKNTYALLIKHHVCEDINKCRSQERVFRAGSSRYAVVNVYIAENLNQVVIQDIVNLHLEAYERHERSQTINLNFYRETMK